MTAPSLAGFGAGWGQFRQPIVDAKHIGRWHTFFPVVPNRQSLSQLNSFKRKFNVSEPSVEDLGLVNTQPGDCELCTNWRLTRVHARIAVIDAARADPRFSYRESWPITKLACTENA
jgi:hypothetical protein